MLLSNLFSTQSYFSNHIIRIAVFLFCITSRISFTTQTEFKNNTTQQELTDEESYNNEKNERYLVDERIIGGTVVDIGEYPSFVSNGYGCGGTLIHPDIVLTAAHCSYKNFPVFIGGVLRNGNDSEKIVATKEIKHPQYDIWSHRNDIMLVLLANTSNATIEFFSNPNSRYPVTNETVTTIGMGQIYDGAVNYTGGLRTVDVNIVSFDSCRKSLKKYYNIYNKQMICAGVPGGGKDACPGDSGGPLFITTTTTILTNSSNTTNNNTTNSANTTITNTTTIKIRNQVGIVSFGRGCGRPGLPGVYTRVSNYYGWIQATICNYSAVPPPGCSIIAPTPTPAPSCPCTKFKIICRLFHRC